MSRPNRNVGFTVLEILIVVAILGIVAAATIPGFVSDGGEKLDLAASEVASAIRFARSEAMRTGTAHGADVERATHRVRVFRLDASNVKFYDVYHPVDKKLYDLSLNTETFTSGVSVTNSDFRFGGSGSQKESVAFDERGAPISPFDLEPMDTGQVSLSLGAHGQTVVVAPMTGRVTIQ